MIEIQSATCGVIYAYCSAGMDESTSQTVFSAHNLICENGELLAEAKPFTDGYAQAGSGLRLYSQRTRQTRPQPYGKQL